MEQKKEDKDFQIDVVYREPNEETLAAMKEAKEDGDFTESLCAVYKWH